MSRIGTAMRHYCANLPQAMGCLPQQILRVFFPCPCPSWTWRSARPERVLIPEVGSSCGWPRGRSISRTRWSPSYWKCVSPKARASYPDLHLSPARRVAVGNLYQDARDAPRCWAWRSAGARRPRPECELGWDMQVGQLSADTPARALE
eukprot:8935783-Pyramimonas_sp.AAC.1